jgi:hypothetical protein
LTVVARACADGEGFPLARVNRLVDASRGAAPGDRAMNDSRLHRLAACVPRGSIERVVECVVASSSRVAMMNRMLTSCTLA